MCCLFFISRSFCCYLFRGWGYNNKSRRGRSCRRRVPFNSPLSYIRLMQFFCAAIFIFLRFFILFLINGFYYFGKANIKTMNYWLRLYFLFLNFRLHYSLSLYVIIELNVDTSTTLTRIHIHMHAGTFFQRLVDFVSVMPVQNCHLTIKQKCISSINCDDRLCFMKLIAGNRQFFTKHQNISNYCTLKLCTGTFMSWKYVRMQS